MIPPRPGKPTQGALLASQLNRLNMFFWARVAIIGNVSMFTISSLNIINVVNPIMNYPQKHHLYWCYVYQRQIWVVYGIGFPRLNIHARNIRNAPYRHGSGCVLSLTDDNCQNGAWLHLSEAGTILGSLDGAGARGAEVIWWITVENCDKNSRTMV